MLKYIAYIYDYELACVDDKFSRPFNTYLRNDTFYNFINSMIEKKKILQWHDKKTF